MQGHSPNGSAHFPQALLQSQHDTKVMYTTLAARGRRGQVSGRREETAFGPMVHAASASRSASRLSVR